MDPALVLDDVFVPEGYHQIDNPSSNALARLEELRLENPQDHYYYLKRENTITPTSNDWIFPQKELKIEFVDYDDSSKPNENTNIHGLVVKKIKGDWNEEVLAL